MAKEYGTVISTFEGPSTRGFSFLVNPAQKVHRGQFIEIDTERGKLIGRISDIRKTNRYYMRPESVKEFEKSGKQMGEIFPVDEWEYLVADVKALGILTEDIFREASFPVSPGDPVLEPENQIMEKFFGLDLQGIHLGSIPYHTVEAKLDMTKLFQKHLAILALSGGGKCVSPSTRVLLSNGDEAEISSLVDEKLSEGFDVEDDVEFCKNYNENLKIFSIDSENRLSESPIKAFCRRKAPGKMIRLQTLTGKVLELTPEHMVPVLDEGIKWIQATKLKEGDYLLLPKPVILGSDQTIELYYISKWIKFHKKIKVDANFARLFGYLLAEGHNNGRMISFTNNSKEIRDDFSQLCIKVFGVQAKRLKRENELRVFNRGLALTLQNIGFTNSSWTKFVPKELLKSKKPVIASFLSTLIDCDGYISKDRGFEICFASQKLIDSVNYLLLRLGIVPIQKEKIIKSKGYGRLSVRGADELAVLRDNLDLLIDYKRKRLDLLPNRKANTNIFIIPNIEKKIKRIMDLLNMSLSQANPTRIINYMYRRDNPSFKSLKQLVDSFDKRVLFLRSKIRETKKLFYSLPKFFEEDAQQIVSEVHEQFYFKQIAAGSGISSTTARRLVRGITAPKRSAFVLAKQALLLQGKDDANLDCIAELDFRTTAEKLNGLCHAMGFEIQKLCAESFLNKQYLYEVANIGKGGAYSHLYVLTERLFDKTLMLEKNMAQAKKEIQFLKSLANSKLFFDPIKKIESFTPKFDYVYDLSVGNRNFVANHLIIHNSYLAGVLIEELLKRNPEQGQLATVIIDPHGEYPSFADDERYSAKTRVFPSSEIRIGVSNLSIYSLCRFMPGLSQVQVRELDRVARELRKSRRGYSLSDLISAVEAREEMKSQTRDVLASVLTGLGMTGIFGVSDYPPLDELARQGGLSIIDLSEEIGIRKKQIIVAYLAGKLFEARRNGIIPPFLLVLEEAHQFCPEAAAKEFAISRSIITQIAREGRKFHASLCLISQRPKYLATTALSQCNTHFILRINNPYDLKHIGESSEGITEDVLKRISSLKVGSGLVVGEAVNFPLFIDIRKRLSKESRKGMPLQNAAVEWHNKMKKGRKDAKSFM